MGKVRRTKTAAAHRSNPVTGSSPQEKKEKKRGGAIIDAFTQIREQFVVQSKRSYDDGRDDSDDDDEFDREHRGTLSEAMSKKIMRVAREQRRKEILQDEEPSHRETAFDNLEEAASDEDDHEGSDAGSDRYISGDEFAEDIGEEDEHALEMLMGGHAQRRTLADMIMEKIMEKEGGASADQLGDQTAFASALERRIEPKIVEVYRNVGKFLSTYRSGKLPKAFKVLPALSDWEELLWLTEPDRWTSVSMREATRLFSSNLNPKMAQRFYNLVLLPKVRENFAEHKRLNFNLYMALKRALYKPAAFFKGILLPLCEAGDCTLREAAIIGSVLAKCSIPVLHSSVALMKIAEMRYSGANSIFMRILLNKKYSLPYKVIAAIVNHFVRFKEASEVMPVLWHRCLLVFAQRYKTDLTVQQKEHLKELLRTQNHEKISPEVRRELFYSASRGQDDMEM